MPLVVTPDSAYILLAVLSAAGTALLRNRSDTCAKANKVYDQINAEIQ